MVLQKQPRIRAMFGVSWTEEAQTGWPARLMRARRYTTASSSGRGASADGKCGLDLELSKHKEVVKE
jgi:hypothetical protein